jgi:hypothetical protein
LFHAAKKDYIRRRSFRIRISRPWPQHNGWRGKNEGKTNLRICPITLCACLDALMSSCCTTCLGESKLMWYKCECIMRASSCNINTNTKAQQCFHFSTFDFSSRVPKFVDNLTCWRCQYLYAR